MKKLLLLFSLLLSFNALGEWEQMTKDTKGSSYYLQLDKIKTHNNYIYFWYLKNNPKPVEWYETLNDIPWLFLSQSFYLEVDCGINRYKVLSNTGYTGPMASGEIVQINDPAPKWSYFPPNSAGESVLETACIVAPLVND